MRQWSIWVNQRGSEFDEVPDLPDHFNLFPVFQCEVFDGCSYTTKEIVRFLSDNLRDQLVQASGSVVVEEWEGLDYCLSGLKGDKICVEQSGGYNEIGLYRDQYGRPSMTLSLNWMKNAAPK